MDNDIQNWLKIKDDVARRRFLELHLDVINSLPADHLAFYLSDLCETSAQRIQTAWRGYRIRKKFIEQRDQLKREKAAVIIQRQVRHWLHTKAEEQELYRKETLCHPVAKISEGKLQKLQQEISQWQENHDIKFPGMKQLTETHCKVQNSLANFYWKVSEGDSRQQRIEARCAQLEAISMLMKELPPLTNSKEMDFNWYHCSSLPLATSARLAHKQQLRKLNAPWWTKLKKQC